MVYVMVEGGVATVVNPDGTENREAVVVDYDEIDQDQEYLRDLIETVTAEPESACRSQVLSELRVMIR